MSIPRTHVVGPSEGHTHTHTVILLHGRDSTALEFASEFFESEAFISEQQPRLLLDLFPSVRWVFPLAAPLHSARFDCDLSQWFDIWSVEEPDERPEMQNDGLRDNFKFIVEVVEEQERDVSRDRIILGGISQGFATAIAAFLSSGRGLAALVGMSTWMPLGSVTRSMCGMPMDKIVLGLQRHLGVQQDGLDIAAMRNTPIFLMHNSDDAVVPVRHGLELRRVLESQFELRAEWHQYDDGGHWINEPQGVDDLVGFLKAIV